MRLKDKIALITAAASGIGRAGATLFAREGAAVAVADIDKGRIADTVAEIKAAGGRAQGIPCDLTKDADSRRIVRETIEAFGGLDILWNNVGHPGPGRVEGVDMDDFDAAMTLNLRSVLITTTEAIPALRARGGGSILFTSSIAAYGPIASPMRETDAPEPEDPYGIAKLSVELDLAAARRVFGLRYVIFRPHNVYGEYQNLGDPYRNVIGIFMNQIMERKPMTIFGDGTQQRAFSYVGDIVPAIAESPWVHDAACQVFNIGAEVPYTVNELASTVAAAMAVPNHPIEHLPPRLEVHTAYSDHGKAERVFGAQQQTPLDVGIRRMAEWARAGGVRSSRPFQGVEVTRQLPERWRRLCAIPR